jgi:hypothetical protein
MRQSVAEANKGQRETKTHPRDETERNRWNTEIKRQGETQAHQETVRQRETDTEQRHTLR